MKAVINLTSTSDQLFLSVQLTQAEPLNCTIYTSEGIACSDGKSAEAMIHELRISLENLASGPYYLQIEAGKNRCVKSFRIQREM